MQTMTQEWITQLAGSRTGADGSSFGALSPKNLPRPATGRWPPPGGPRSDPRHAVKMPPVFLHNLLTNDIQGISAGGARFAGFCTPKGRLLAFS
jgi:hypothetical protein